MLFNKYRHPNSLAAGVDSIHNFYEHRVLEQIAQVDTRAQTDGDFLADVACVALNRLPPRYIRHDVDITFFMSPQEMTDMESKVEIAVYEAIEYVSRRDRHNQENDSTDT